jgi:hypothetical protein
LSASGPNSFFHEFWPIEKEKNNLNKLSIMYEFNRNKKNPFEQKLDPEIEYFCGKKLTLWFSFWPHKLTLWARKTISVKNIVTPEVSKKKGRK